jgi:CRP-like cAMP-binding protein
MYRAAVQRRRQSDQRALLARLDVRNRLARWLLELATEVGEEIKDGWAIESTLSQQDLAGRIGASRDAVAIELRRLRESGLVSTGQRRIVLHDLEALRRLSSN